MKLCWEIMLNETLALPTRDMSVIGAWPVSGLCCHLVATPWSYAWLCFIAGCTWAPGDVMKKRKCWWISLIAPHWKFIMSVIHSPVKVLIWVQSYYAPHRAHCIKAVHRFVQFSLIQELLWVNEVKNDLLEMSSGATQSIKCSVKWVFGHFPNSDF